MPVMVVVVPVVMVVMALGSALRAALHVDRVVAPRLAALAGPAGRTDLAGATELTLTLAGLSLSLALDVGRRGGARRKRPGQARPGVAAG